MNDVKSPQKSLSNRPVIKGWPVLGAMAGSLLLFTGCGDKSATTTTTTSTTTRASSTPVATAVPVSPGATPTIVQEGVNLATNMGGPDGAAGALAQRVANATNDAVTTAVEAVTGTDREVIAKKMQDRIDIVTKEVERLRASAQQNPKLQAALDEVIVKRDQLKSRLKELGTQTTGAWDDIVAGVSASVVDMEKSLAEAQARYR